MGAGLCGAALCQCVHVFCCAYGVCEGTPWNRKGSGLKTGRKLEAGVGESRGS